MRGRIRFGIGLALVTCAAVSLPSPARAGDLTVGEFLVKFVSLKDPSAVDFNAARTRLRAAGVVLPPLDPAKALTQGDVVAIGNAAGFRLTTHDPAAPFGPSDTQTFLAVFGRQIQTIGGSGSGTQSPMDAPGGGQGGGQGGGPQGGNGNGQGGNGNGQGHNKSPIIPG